MKEITIKAETDRRKEEGRQDFRRRQAKGACPQARDKEQCAQHVWEAAHAWGTDTAKGKSAPEAKCWR